MAWIEELFREGEKRVGELEVYWFSGTSVSADLKQRRVALCSSSVETGMCIRTIDKGRIGSSSTNDPRQWQACLDAAVAGGRLATPQEWKGLPEPAALPETDFAWDPTLAIEPATAQEMLDGMLDGASGYPDAAVTSGGAGVAAGEVTIANSHGVRYTSRQSDLSISLETISGQSTGYEFDHAWEKGLVDPRRVGKRAACLASRSQGGKDIPSGEYDIILSPMAFADLLSGIFVPALSGRNVLQGRSKLAGKIGEAVAAPGISFYDDPHRPGAAGSTWFDAEGTPTRRLDFVKDGILSGFAYDLKTAYRAGLQSTASAIRGGFAGLPAIGHHNFVVDGKREALFDEPAIYVHGVVGAHTANPLSGDFSVEMSNPFRVRDGELAEPVRGAMLTGNFFELLGNIEALGTKDRAVGSYILPPVKIKKTRVIGK
ncbi:TldD/PmbA family protein [Methanoregula sp.]|uniref:TldD/PmbA family protein n=1 Tax=Methanoregula sp. TaxID=2052170 RepID=UPI002BAD4FCA|nr:metallopeptidase TldD-related protein [Methanoregula sp.]HVP95640.1 metallopeptidase TldD-related protein [Methanoregula sp.]